MADTEPTATAEATSMSQAQIADEFWQAMKIAEEKLREAWLIGSGIMPNKAAVVAKLNLTIAQLEYARDLMS